LGVDQPFYGFKPLGMSGENVEPVSVENMAIQYIKAMKQKQPTGPYFIGGYCLGGMISYEMARQLESEGEKIAFLGLISTTTPEYLQSYKEGITVIHRYYYKLSERIKLELNNLSNFGTKDRTRYFKHRARQVINVVWVRIEVVIWRLFNLHNVTKAKHSRAYNNHKLCSFQRAAFFEYRFHPIKSKITVFRPSNPYLALKDDPTLGFGNLSETGTEDYEIDCFHKNILKEPNVKNLARTFRGCLNKAYAV
jgi:thioesterase domain-containing protein